MTGNRGGAKVHVLVSLRNCSGQPMNPLKATVAQAGVALGIRSELFFQCRRALYGGTATRGP